jgi:hypothetical protein
LPVSSKKAPAVLTCAHCYQPQRGYAVVGYLPVCHPDVGMDCYARVTVYGHRMPCEQCMPVAAAARKSVPACAGGIRCATCTYECVSE